MNAKFLLAAPFALAFTACDPTGATLDTSGIDPLRPPAGNVNTTDEGTAFKPGEFVTAAINNTAFYKAKPKEDQEADKLLTQGTPMKIVALSGSFTKVELDSGEVGFVPTVMITSGEAELSPIEGAPDTPIPIINLDSEMPLPVLDPSTAPIVEPGNLPPIESDGLPPAEPVPPTAEPEKPVAE
ncbi:MAG: hypothetical protein V4727_00850 [Verrucomicrobiota bacterium]